VDLYRFIEGTGIVLPVSGSYSKSVSQPRFTAGDDVVRTGALQDASTTKNETRTFGTSYSRTWTDRSNPFLRFTLGGLTGSYNYSENTGTGPTSLYSSVARTGIASWGVSPRNLMRIPLPITRLALFPLPERVFWTYAVNTSNSVTLDRARDGSILPRNNVTSRSSVLNFGADTRPIDILHHHIDATRNLNLSGPLMEHVGFINFGRVVMWKQNLDSRVSLNRGAWLSPGFSWNANYNQDNRPELSPDLSVRAVSNGQSVTVNWNLPFDRLGSNRRMASDTSHSAMKWFKPGSALAHLGNLSADAGINQSSNYSRLTGTPSPAYLFGLSSKPGFGPPGQGVQSVFGGYANRNIDFRTSARTRVPIAWDASVSARGEYTDRRSNSNDVITRTTTERFPDLDFDYGKIARVSGLYRIMDNPSLRTSYTRSIQTDFRGNGSDVTARSTSSQWSPLISLSGTLKNQTRTELRIERRITKRDNFQLKTSTTTDRNTDLNLNLSRAYTRGQKVTVLGRETSVKSSVNLSLAAVYSKHTAETIQQGYSQPTLPINQDRLSLTGSGAYSFTNNVTGNLTLGFGQNRDIERDIISRNIRVEVRGTFGF
jgi:hypothetical protein